ncbi:MAG: SLC13 family permease [Planctomycetota bacterium]
MSTTRKPPEVLRRWGLFAFGPGVGLLAYGFLRAMTDMEPVAASIAMLCIWMAIWWMTEVVPLELTALLPMLVLPLTGLYSSDAMMKACAPYAHESVYFFLGGFGLGLAIEKTELHRRGALVLLRLAGTDAQIVVAAFMACTAILSMWMNNTATTMLMLPLATSVIATKSDKRFATSLLIGVAYAASIGGMSTLVGTAPNIFFTGFLKDKGLEIGFLPWMAFALPTALVILAGAWVWMVKILWPMHGLQIEIPREWVEAKELQPGWTSHQRMVLTIFGVVAIAWISRDPLLWIPQNTPIHGWLQAINDPWIAMCSLALLLMFPIGNPVLQWSDVERSPWGVLLLFGGGMSLSKAISASGLDGHIAEATAVFGFLPSWLLLVMIVILVILVSEMASNIATATTMLPILMSAAPTLGIDPLMLLTAAVLASSCGFMMPVATPPNTMVFALKRFPVRDMLLAGLGVNILSVVAIVVFVMWVLPLVAK